MKRFLLVVFFVILAGTGMFLAQAHSYLTLTYDQWTVQIQLWLVILALLLLLIAYKGVSIIWQAICYFPLKIKRVLQQRREKRAQEEQHTYEQTLQQINQATDLVTLKNCWQHIPQRWRHNSTCAAAYIRIALRFGGDPSLGDLIEWHLARDWQEALVNYYGLLPQNAEKRLKHLDQWILQHPTNPLLLLAAARLQMTAKQWGKAEQLLQQSLMQKPSVAAYLDLATVQHQLGKTDAAWRQYQAASNLQRQQELQ